MTDDAKEWVTIKVPKTVRDDARDDPRTYGEIMRAGLGTGPTELSAGADLCTDALATEIRAELETDAPNFDDVQGAKREVLNRIDDLETELTRQHEGLTR